MLSNIKETKMHSNIDLFWYFVCERMRLFWNKKHRPNAPHLWTPDSKLEKGSYTNVYRVLDRVSQYLLRYVIYDGKTRTKRQEFFRIMLFKLFNSPETWESIPEHLKEFQGSFGSKSWSALDKHFKGLYDYNTKIFRGSYIMPSAYACRRHHCKFSFRAMLEILREMMDQEIDKVLVDCEDMKEAYNVLRRISGLGPFLAYQFVQDLNYAWGLWDENEFVALGPGAQRGVDLCFPELAKQVGSEEIIDLCRDTWYSNIKKRDLVFHGIGRAPTLIDVQNCFCEIQKYLRPNGPKRNYRPHRTPLLAYVFPDWWQLSSFPEASKAAEASLK